MDSILSFLREVAAAAVGFLAASAFLTSLTIYKMKGLRRNAEARLKEWEAQVKAAGDALGVDPIYGKPE